MAIEDYYTSTITRKVLSTTDSVYSKNDAESWTGTGTFKARIQTLSSDELILDESRKPLATHRGFCDASVTVLYTDKWANEGSDLFDGWDFTTSQEWSFSDIVLGETTATGFETDAAGGAFANITTNPSRTLVAGLTYEVIFAGTTNASGCSVFDGQTGGVEIGTLNGTYVFTVNDSSDGKLFIKNADAGVTNITTLTVRQVSATYEVTGIFLVENATTSHHYEVELKLV